jgi:cell wall assembly regulator SMI1
MADAIRLSEELLEELAERWRAMDAPVARQLQPGLAGPDIDATVESLGLSVPPEARTWWGWHDGACQEALIVDGGKSFASLEVCVQDAVMMRQIAVEVAAPYRMSDEERVEMVRGVWNPDWLPLCRDSFGCQLVISCTAEDAARDMSQVYYRDWDGAIDLVTPSIGTLVRAWIAVLDAGLVTRDIDADRMVLTAEGLPPEHDEHIL